MSVISLYETLRLDVLDGASGQAQGWVLFIRSGMRSWCEVCHQDALQPQAREQVPPSDPSVATPFERTLIQVLAGMVINLQQGVSGHV
jgi:hypothetical protein